MGRMTGADPEELERFAHTIRVAADRLEVIRAEVTTSFHRSQWDGNDADHFRGQWNYRLSGMIQTTVVANREAAQVLIRNAHQQRCASNADGWTPVSPFHPWTFVTPVTPVGPDLVELLRIGVTAAGQFMLIPGLLNVVDDVRKGGLPGIFDNKLLRGLIREHNVSGILGPLDKLGPLAIAGGIFDAAELLSKIDQYGLDSPQALAAGIDVAFDVAEGVATFVCPPVALGIGLAHLAFDVYEALPAETQAAIVHGVQDAAGAVVDTVADVAEGAVNMVGGAAEAVGGFISGGANAIGNIFGL